MIRINRYNKIGNSIYVRGYMSRDSIYVRGYGFLSFAKNMGKNIDKIISKNVSGINIVKNVSPQKKLWSRSITSIFKKRKKN